MEQWLEHVGGFLFLFGIWISPNMSSRIDMPECNGGFCFWVIYVISLFAGLSSVMFLVTFYR